MTQHVPVLIKEVLQYLDVKPNENVVDGTLGQGGHAILMLQKNGPEGKLLGIDLDSQQIKNSSLLLSGFGHRALLVNDSYANIKEIIEKNNFGLIDAMLLDLGYSSWHLEESKKGFSFLKDEPLDMRYGFGSLTAEKIVNEYPVDKIIEILQDYGEESFAKQITKEIIAQRKIKKIESTLQLKEIILQALPQKFRYGRINGATKTFQALRIAVNNELAGLQKSLPDILSVMGRGARLVIISFHSLEDRIVKNFFREQESLGVAKILTKKPVMAEDDEVLINPRSRSAKLRAIIKI